MANQQLRVPQVHDLTDDGQFYICPYFPDSHRIAVRQVVQIASGIARHSAKCREHLVKNNYGPHNKWRLNNTRQCTAWCKKYIPKHHFGPHIQYCSALRDSLLAPEIPANEPPGIWEECKIEPPPQVTSTEEDWN